MHSLIRSALMISTLAALAFGATGLASAANGQVTVENLRGPLVNASFSSTDPSGCIETDVFVTANRPTEQQLPGPGTTTGVGGVSIWRYDACTGTTLLDATGGSSTIGPDQFQVSRQLDWAWLNTSFAANDLVSGSTLTIAVNVGWTGTGALYRADSNSNDRYGGHCHVLNRWKGTGRDAVASGSVSDGVTNYIAGTTAPYAEIGFVIDGFEVIDCA